MAETAASQRVTDLRSERDRNGLRLATALLERIEELLRGEFADHEILGVAVDGQPAPFTITAAIEPGDFGEPGFTLHEVEAAGIRVWDIETDDPFTCLSEVEALLDEMAALNPSDFESVETWEWAFTATRPCGMQWHYGTIAPVNHSDPQGPTGWTGVHGLPTTNPSGICDECAEDWRLNYPGYSLPRALPVPGASQ